MKIRILPVTLCSSITVAGRYTLVIILSRLVATLAYWIHAIWCSLFTHSTSNSFTHISAKSFPWGLVSELQSVPGKRRGGQGGFSVFQSRRAGLIHELFALHARGAPSDGWRSEKLLSSKLLTRTLVGNHDRPCWPAYLAGAGRKFSLLSFPLFLFDSHFKVLGGF